MRYHQLARSCLSEDSESCISPAWTIIEEAKAGKMFILVDDRDRENEGDLIIPADKITPEAINFMVREARGLVCLAMSGEMIDRLRLEMQPSRNESRFGTAFTVSIEAKEGVTTGISAFDRAHTIKTAVDPKSGPEDISTPGHIFPLRAREGGVLERRGHTEASVDIAVMAGFSPAGVICEIMNDDGTMARLPDLAKFARRHDMKVGCVADLVDYMESRRKAG